MGTARVQICFDFMEDEHDGMMTIECNPRNSTVVADFHDSPDFKQVPAYTSAAHLILPSIAHLSMMACWISDFRYCSNKFCG